MKNQKNMDRNLSNVLNVDKFQGKNLGIFMKFPVANHHMLLYQNNYEKQ